MESSLLLFFALFGLINLYAFSLMLSDKKKARRKEPRISEGDLLFVAICFGALGIYLGMFASRHKTQKIIFALGVPLALAENLAVIYFLYLILA